MDSSLSIIETYRTGTTTTLHVDVIAGSGDGWLGDIWNQDLHDSRSLGLELMNLGSSMLNARQSQTTL